MGDGRGGGVVGWLGVWFVGGRIKSFKGYDTKTQTEKNRAQMRGENARNST